MPRIAPKGCRTGSGKSPNTRRAHKLLLPGWSKRRTDRSSSTTPPLRTQRCPRFVKTAPGSACVPKLPTIRSARKILQKLELMLERPTDRDHGSGICFPSHCNPFWWAQAYSPWTNCHKSANPALWLLLKFQFPASNMCPPQWVVADAKPSQPW